MLFIYLIEKKYSSDVKIQKNLRNLLKSSGSRTRNVVDRSLGVIIPFVWTINTTRLRWFCPFREKEFYIRQMCCREPRLSQTKSQWSTESIILLPVCTFRSHCNAKAKCFNYDDFHLAEKPFKAQAHGAEDAYRTKSIFTQWMNVIIPTVWNSLYFT